MAKVRSNLILHGVSGMIGNQIVVRRGADGEFVLSSRPQRGDRVPTAQQAEHRKNFHDAVLYAKDAQKSPDYQEAADAPGLSAFNVAVADFLNAPEIRAIDLSGYTGEAGQRSSSARPTT